MDQLWYDDMVNKKHFWDNEAFEFLLMVSFIFGFFILLMAVSSIIFHITAGWLTIVGFSALLTAFTVFTTHWWGID